MSIHFHRKKKQKLNNLFHSYKHCTQRISCYKRSFLLRYQFAVTFFWYKEDILSFVRNLLGFTKFHITLMLIPYMQHRNHNTALLLLIFIRLEILSSQCSYLFANKYLTLLNLYNFCDLKHYTDSQVNLKLGRNFYSRFHAYALFLLCNGYILQFLYPARAHNFRLTYCHLLHYGSIIPLMQLWEAIIKNLSVKTIRSFVF